MGMLGGTLAVMGVVTVTVLGGALVASLVWRPQVLAAVSEQSVEVSKLDLTGRWTITNQNNSISLFGFVPGNIYTALMSAGTIGDPYYRFNDLHYRWIHYDHWTYQRSFVLSETEIQKNALLLVCEGLDTVASIFINGKPIGTSKNQFIKYVYDVKPYVQIGNNTIIVAFRSAVDYAKQKFDNHSYLVPPSCPPAEYNPECHANFIRKAQCSFSWDWGPAFATQGIWQDIYLHAFNTAVIRDVVVIASKQDSPSGQYVLNTTVHVDIAPNPQGNTQDIYVRVSVPEKQAQREVYMQVRSGTRSASVSIVIYFNQSEIDAWWPRGYGSPKRYDVIISCGSESGAEDDTRMVKTGFRTVEIVQDELPNGLTFYFKINDVPIFMKGSNWIPADSFLDRVTHERLRRLLTAAVHTNMNTLRVWGGGVYESRAFYELADELGLLVWQDMMFACSMYPADHEFLANVQQEVISQVRRLGRHPSIVAWAANNENEGALVDNWYGTAGPLYNRYKRNYVDLYINTIRRDIFKEDSSRPFLPSSPTNGLLTKAQGWISEDPRPSSADYGDVHYYNYEADCWDLSIYPGTRYSSEYGYQSWPAFSTVKKISKPEDWYYNSPFCRHRQHKEEAGNGTDQMIRRHFKWPNSGDSLKDFKAYIYLTQITQALCYKFQTEFYRRSQSDNASRTMGALYWQHNDIWQAPSWATIDFEGNWKMAHYYAAHFFADVIVSAREENGNLKLYAVSDMTSQLQDVEIRTWLWTWSKQTQLHMWSHKENNLFGGSQMIYEKPLADMLAEGGCAERAQCFFTFGIYQNDQQISSNNTFYTTSFSSVVGLQSPNLKIYKVEEVKEQEFRIQLTGGAIAPFVWLEVDGISGHFSDNGFLMTNSHMNVTFFSYMNISREEIEESITVISLTEIY